MFTKSLTNLVLPLIACAYLANANSSTQTTTNDTAEIDETEEQLHEWYPNAGVFINEEAV